jgi:hypothetical protein
MHRFLLRKSAFRSALPRGVQERGEPRGISQPDPLPERFGQRRRAEEMLRQRLPVGMARIVSGVCEVFHASNLRVVRIGLRRFILPPLPPIA